jgi:hypothetical protein
MIAGGRPNLIGISGKMGSGKDTLSFVLNYLADNFAPDFIGRWEQPIDEFVYKNKKYSEKLKYMVCFLIGCSRSDLEDREFKEKELGEDWIVHWYKDNKGRKFLTKTASEAANHPDRAVVGQDMLTPRLLLQLLGTEAGRQIIHPNIWVNALFADYKKIAYNWDCDGNTTVEGYPNWIITDVRFPNEAKAIKDRGGILIRINRPQYLDNGLVIRKDEHLSETALDDYDGFDYVIENNSSSIADLVEQVKQLKIV